VLRKGSRAPSLLPSTVFYVMEQRGIARGCYRLLECIHSSRAQTPCDSNLSLSFPVCNAPSAIALFQAFGHCSRLGLSLLAPAIAQQPNCVAHRRRPQLTSSRASRQSMTASADGSRCECFQRRYAGPSPAWAARVWSPSERGEASVAHMPPLLIVCFKWCCPSRRGEPSSAVQVQGNSACAKACNRVPCTQTQPHQHCLHACI